MPTTTSSFNGRILAARSGDSDALVQLLDSYRHYLRLLARLQINRILSARVSPSDVAQESILRARDAFQGFKGTTERELLAWLRRVLATQLARVARFHTASQRDVGLEKRFHQAVDQSSADMATFIQARQQSPSQDAVQREETVLLSEALSRLPDDYREVIVLKHFEGKSFPEISERLSRTVPAVKSIWTRAISKLRNDMTERE